MDQTRLDKIFIAVLHIIKWILIITISSVGIILLMIVLAILGVDLPDIEPLIQLLSLPVLLLGNSIALKIIGVFFSIVSVITYLSLRKDKE